MTEGSRDRLIQALKITTLAASAVYLVMLVAQWRGVFSFWLFQGYWAEGIGLCIGLAVFLILFTQEMGWIALKMLTGDKAKFFGIVLGLTFAALLITQQGSIFCGLMRRTAGQIEDIRGADLWVMDSNVRFVDDVKPMLETNLYRVRGVEGVRWAVPLYKGNARLKLKTTVPDIDPETNQPKIDPRTGQPKRKDLNVIEQVILLGLDDASLVGAPPPARIVVGSLNELRKTDAILIDYNRLPKLFPGERWDQAPQLPGLGKKVGYSVQSALASFSHRFFGKEGEEFAGVGPSPEEEYRASQSVFYERFVGREVEMNDHRGIIVGVCEATRTFQSNPVVYTLYSRAKQYVPRERKILSYVLAKTESGQQPENVAKKISSQTGLKARTSEEFMWDTMGYYFKYTGIPINFGITTLLGFFVGTAIAGQTFYNFTIENLKQFGSLKAMGATNTRIVGMILLQATVVGLLGYGLGVGLASLFGQISQGGELAYFTWWPVLPVAGVSIVLICILASILCIRRVIVLEPAVVFRG